MERPNLLITDIRMDGMSGIEVMQELSKERPMPTILISAHYQLEDLNDNVEGNLIAFLRKPVKIADLRLAVAEAAVKIS